MLLRIDDYSIENHATICLLIYKAKELLPELTIIVGVIVGNSEKMKLTQLLKGVQDVLLAFHGVYHSNKEFLGSHAEQEKSFLEAETFFQSISYKKRFFIPPMNSFNNDTISLLKKYMYDTFSLNYKDFQKNKQTLESHFHILETNYFFNKKRADGSWFIDDRETIGKELDNLREKNLGIGIEIHPQYIKTSEDLEKYIFLLHYIKNVY